MRADVLLGCFCDAFGWGGALAFVDRLGAACEARGVTTALIGVSSQPEPAGPLAERQNVRVARSALLWRVQSWRVVGLLQRELGRFTPPSRAVVALSPYWVVAARNVWPQVPVVYKVPCLLSNCLPFTWPHRRPPGFWKQVDFAGIRRAERQALSVADTIVVPTRAAADEVCAFLPAAVERVRMVPYGCPPQAPDAAARSATRAELGLAAEDVLFLAAGVCDRNKAVDWAVREIAISSPQARLVIIGDGPQRAALEALVQALHLENRVHVVGPHADLRRWYSAADVVLSTSLYDMYPNTIQEGLAYGRPVLLPAHAPPRVYAGASEVLEAVGGGCVYDRLRPGDLARCINALVDHPEWRTALGQQARDAARERADWGPLVNCVLSGRVVRPGSKSSPSPQELISAS